MPRAAVLGSPIKHSLSPVLHNAGYEAAGLAAEGLDLAIIYLPHPHDVAVLEPLAEAIRDSGLQTA